MVIYILLNKIRLYLKIFHEQRNILNSEKRFYDIAQSISDGIYTIDFQTKTTFINKEALRLLGYRNKELLGKKIHDFIHYKDNLDNQIESSHVKYIQF